MPEVCGVSHPAHPERTCIKAPGWHANHSAGSDLAWEAAGVREEVVHTVATRPGATPQQIRDGVRQIADGVRNGQRSAGGPAAAAAGAQQAYGATNEEFKARAFEAVHAVAIAQPTLTADDVWQYLREHGFDVDGAEHRTAMGHVMRQAATRGWTEKTDDMVKTGRGEQRAHGLTVWRSLKHGVVTTQVLRHTGPTP